MANEFPAASLAKRALLVSLCVLLVFAVAAGAWIGRRVLLVLFAGVLLSVLLDRIAMFLAHRLGLRRGLALGLAVLLLTVAVGGIGWLLGTRLGDQAGEIGQTLPDLGSEIQGRLQSYSAGRYLLQHLPSGKEIISRGSGFLRELTGLFSGVLGLIGNLVVISFVGLYLAIDPTLYRKGIVQLFPPAVRDRVGEALRCAGEALGAWLVAKLSLMCVVGVLTAIGLLALGLPFVLSLALLAAALDFIPNIGPVISAVPALLLALLKGPTTALWVTVLYLAVQFLESYILAPIVQHRAVSIPPALLISSQVFLAVLLGLPGLLFATPLTVVLLVLVRRLYVKDFLEGSQF